MAWLEGRIMSVDQCGQDPGSSLTVFDLPRQLSMARQDTLKAGQARAILLGLREKVDVSGMPRGVPGKGSRCLENDL